MGGSVFSRISSPWAIERAIGYKLSNATHRLFELTEFVIASFQFSTRCAYHSLKCRSCISAMRSLKEGRAASSSWPTARGERPPAKVIAIATSKAANARDRGRRAV